jgi:hypothetical protein
MIHRTEARRRRGAVLRPMLCLALLAATTAAAADDLPAFRKGQWEFERTIEAGGGKKQTIKSSRCLAPTEDMKAQNERLAKAGCKFTPVTRSGSNYTFGSQCTIQGIVANSTTTITPEGDSAYRLVVEGITAGEKTRDVLVAKRVGDCK